MSGVAVVDTLSLRSYRVGALATNKICMILPGIPTWRAMGHEYNPISPCVRVLLV